MPSHRLRPSRSDDQALVGGGETGRQRWRESRFFKARQAGYAKEFHVERYWREVRLQRIAPISRELVLNYMTDHVLGLPRSVASYLGRPTVGSSLTRLGSS